jgi:hypothetical protein
MRERLIEIFTPGEGAEDAETLADVILAIKDRERNLTRELIERKIAEHGIGGDDRTYLEDIVT